MEISAKIKKQGFFWLALLFVIGWTLLLWNMSPEEIVESLGVANTYLVAFLISIMGALSSLTTFSTYPAIVALAAGEVNPLFLGIAAGLGLAAGDIFFYFFGISARNVASEKVIKWVEKILKWLMDRSKLFIQFFIFFYVGFTPFPNNILTGLLALREYPFKKVVVPLVLGDLVLPITVAYLTYKGWDGIFG
jgi:membrane protein YqaA with SNARE-associated domain